MKTPEAKPELGPDPDLPIYEALVRAIIKHGLQDRLKLSGPPQNGAVTLEVTAPNAPRHPRSAPGNQEQQ